MVSKSDDFGFESLMASVFLWKNTFADVFLFS
jgi:hypothetical protein